MTHFKLEADSGLLGSHQKPMQKGEMQQEGKKRDGHGTEKCQVFARALLTRSA